MSESVRYMTAREVLEIPERDLPLIVLSDNAQSFLGWGIRHHTSGLWQHAMVMHARGAMASQEWTLRTRLAAEYVRGAHRLKFWRCTGADETARAMAIAKVVGDLQEPALWHAYDLLGILGQWLGLVRLQIPGLTYCSEYDAQVVRILDPEGEAPEQPSPSGLDAWFKARPERWECYGRFDPDSGMVGG